LKDFRLREEEREEYNAKYDKEYNKVNRPKLEEKMDQFKGVSFNDLTNNKNNGIIILETLSPRQQIITGPDLIRQKANYLFEYRVKYIDKKVLKNFNKCRYIAMFHDCNIITNENLAIEIADKLLEQYDDLEFGIETITCHWVFPREVNIITDAINKTFKIKEVNK